MTGARVAMLVLAACATSSAWTESDVVFTRYSPLSRNAEIKAIDARFAGLAAAGIVELDARLGWSRGQKAASNATSPSTPTW